MLNLFRPKIKPVSGVLPDDRPPELVAKDYLTEELIKQPVQALNWISWEEWKAKPENIKMLNDIEVNNQGQVGSCASHASSLALAINNYLEDKKFLKFSAKPIYARRKINQMLGCIWTIWEVFVLTMGRFLKYYIPVPMILTNI